MNTKIVGTALVALLAGVAIGYFLQPSAEVAAAPVAPLAHHKAATHVVVADQQENVQALRKRVRDLEHRLATLTTAAAALTNAPQPEARADRGHRFGPPNAAEMRARLEELRTKDPERYAQMTNRMTQGRLRMQAHAQDRMDFLAELDTSRMTAKQKANHEQLQNMLARREELMRMMDPEDESITDAQREKARNEMRQTMRQLRTLEEKERDMLLEQTAKNLGYKGSDAREIVETIKTIYDATQSGWRGGGGPGGPGGPPPQR